MLSTLLVPSQRALVSRLGACDAQDGPTEVILEAVFLNLASLIAAPRLDRMGPALVPRP